MATTSPPFLFAFNDKEPYNARGKHIRQLFDVFNVCLLRGDYNRARRAWSILAGCKELDLTTLLWPLSLQVICSSFEHEHPSWNWKLEFLRSLMFRRPEDKESILKELILTLIRIGRHKEALDELELYLPSFPFQENAVFHIYAGQLKLYLSQEPEASNPGSEGEPHILDKNAMSEALAHFKRVKQIDSQNVVADAFIEKINLVLQS